MMAVLANLVLVPATSHIAAQTPPPSMYPNLALGQSTAMSSGTSGFRAVDGSSSTIALSTTVNESWWEVDLSTFQSIQSLVIQRDAGCCMEQPLVVAGVTWRIQVPPSTDGANQLAMTALLEHISLEESSHAELAMKQAALEIPASTIQHPLILIPVLLLEAPIKRYPSGTFSSQPAYMHEERVPHQKKKYSW